MAMLDVNKDGVVSREDFELMGIRMSEHGKLNEEQAKRVKEGFLKVADLTHLKEGVQFPVSEYVPKLSNTLLSKTPDERKAMIQQGPGSVFEVIDTSGDGRISVEEFKVYLKVVAADVTEEEAEHAFNTIDADKSGEISQEEFLAVAEDFFFGVEETEVSRVFLGKLID